MKRTRQNSTPPLPPLMTVQEFAVVAKLHPKSVYAMAKRGALPGARYFGGALRIITAEALGHGVASASEAAGLLEGK